MASSVARSAHRLSKFTVVDLAWGAACRCPPASLISQTSAVQSLLPDASLLPFAENARATTGPRCPSNLFTSAPVAGFQTRTRRSSPPVATSLLWAENAMALTWPSAASQPPQDLPLNRSHSRSTPSLPPVATRRPSGDRAKALIGLLTERKRN